MCGLPGCGKTVWANEWASKYPEKFYNILGSNNLIDKMKVKPKTCFIEFNKYETFNKMIENCVGSLTCG